MPGVNVDLTDRVPNKHSPRRGTIIAIVDHIMAGTLAGTDTWFENPANQVSAHYGVGKGGEIHKYVRDGDEAWHSGVVNAPTAAIVLARPGVDPNWYTIGIEHEGMSGDALTEEQYQATLWLHKALIGAYGIAADPDHIIGHHTINADHAGCPGSGFPWARLLGDL